MNNGPKQTSSRAVGMKGVRMARALYAKRSSLEPHIAEIRKALAAGETRAAVAQRFGVTRSGIDDFAKRHNLVRPHKRYSHLRTPDHPHGDREPIPAAHFNARRP